MAFKMKSPFNMTVPVVKSKATLDGEAGYAADDLARKNKTGIYAPKGDKPKPRKKVKAIEPAKARKIKAEDKKVSEISTKKPTVKVAPKDNSRKAIKKRKTADKAAGVSKSQMRANKAKSKAEAALEKAKKSKNPSYKAQLKRKADRLAARAKRKGGSPVKAVGDPKLPKLQVKKTSKKKVDKDPVKYFKSFESKATQRTAKNPYPKESVRNRKFAQLQKKLKDSSM